MRVLITGIGDAFTARYFGTGALIEGPEGYVLIDCPELVHRALRAASDASGWQVDAMVIHDIILTHLHGDHCNGLESFGFLRRAMRMRLQAGAPPLPRLHTTEPVAARLWERLAPAMDGPWGGDTPSTIEDYFDVRIISPDAPAVVAGLEVNCRFTRHSVPTIGLFFIDGTKSFGWSGDTTFDPALIDWLSGADLIVHEGGSSEVHTEIDDLNALPERLRAKMRLIHLQDDYDPASSTIRALSEGEVLDL